MKYRYIVILRDKEHDKKLYLGKHLGLRITENIDEAVLYKSIGKAKNAIESLFYFKRNLIFEDYEVEIVNVELTLTTFVTTISSLEEYI